MSLTHLRASSSTTTTSKLNNHLHAPIASSSSTSSLASTSSIINPNSSPNSHSNSKPKGLKKLRPWSLAAHARRKTGWNTSNDIGDERGQEQEIIRDDFPEGNDIGRGESLYTNGNANTRIRIAPDQSPRRSSDTTRNLNPNIQIGSSRSEGEQEIHDWDEEEEDEDERIDGYSWIDPSFIGTERFRDTPAASRPDLTQSYPQSPNETSRNTSPGNEIAELLETPSVHPSPPAQLLPENSYALLLAYQNTDSGHTKTPSSNSHGNGNGNIDGNGNRMPLSPTLPGVSTPSERGNTRDPNPEWYELVDHTLSDSLSKDELKRQGLWWEMIKGEREYVRDMKIVCDVFIQPLRDHEPPLLAPESRLNAFVAEVFSTAQQIYHAHVRLLGRLMERQRHEWPLMTTATDIILGILLEIVDLYESYMKNYPFAEARVRREQERSPPFRTFLSERNSYDLTRRRDISVFLSRPVTRLPRILLVLEALYKVTPPDHPDKEDIPAAMEILHGVVRSTQPGIESAENKIRLWNTAERLLFKKGEIIELDIADPKRTLVHMGYVFRRVRSETNWHGWQDLRAILLDNYFLLTRDEENGKHVVVSRPIHLDFLNLISADGVPERRYDSVSRYQRKPGGHMLEPVFQPERLMFPFTISTSGGINGRTYALCTAEEWKEKIEGAKTLRKFDIEGNRTFAVHTITIPLEIRDSIMAADTFSWHNRETVAIATSKSVWLGWRRDSKTFRELIRYNSGHISMVAVIPDFGWLLILTSGSLLAYNLREMIPTSNPETWVFQGRMQGERLSAPEHTVAFVRIGVTKGRLLVVYAVHSKNSHQTNLYFHEPLINSTSYASPSFRPFGTIIVPGYASDLSFFRQTVSVITEKTFIVAEPGNPTFNPIPTFPVGIPERATVVRMVSQAKPLGMWQVEQGEFLLVYEWGACWVSKFGEVSRKGSFLRWNLTPSYAIFKQPYLMLFEESSGRAEVRDVTTGRVCEVIDEKGMKIFTLSRINQGVVARASRGLIEIVETVPL
ncbi:uncharacterized protein IL334_003972 [Kwoniella shivajii]|uniref:DH domain-containing protein n=1 Tax=Kwoniella shivajii TaxID=564305 RepID=A0ABZ1CZF7_9TREE|nr:hypothetical protein IL334_003972 [Kwoniella shivajii]